MLGSDATATKLRDLNRLRQQCVASSEHQSIELPLVHTRLCERRAHMGLTGHRTSCLSAGQGFIYEAYGES